MHVMKVVAVLKINLFFFYSFFFNPETFNIFPQIWSHYPAESSSGNVKSLQPFRHLFPYRTRVFALAEYNCKLFIWTVHTGTFIFSLQVIISVNRVCVFFFFFSVCAVDLCLLSCTGWIIHLQADEKRAGKVRSAEVEWPWFLLAAGHPAVAVVIIHTSQMAFPWASMKRTGQGLSCQVLPGSEATLGQCGTWGVRECFWMVWRWEAVVKPGGNAAWLQSRFV